MRPTFTLLPLTSALLAVFVALGVAGCAVGPTYQRPTAPEPVAYKELQGWTPAAPADALDRGPWWTLFRDPQLSGLMDQVEVSNQNVAAAVASYAQARALVTEQRAGLFPTLSLNASGNRSGSRAGNGTTTGVTTGTTTGTTAGTGTGTTTVTTTRGGSVSNDFQLGLAASWEPDVWGRLRAGVTAAQASADISAADLASARLSAQGLLATDYFNLRSVDAQRALLATTIAGYERLLTITQNRFNAGIAAHTDVFQAETQLATTRNNDLSLARQRAQLEHAIAVLVGKTPADFAIAPLALPSQSAAELTVFVPDVPVGVPSTLLQRRPDIAAAERQVAYANAQIGIARAAYYPNIGLTAQYGTAASTVGDLLNASAAAWSFGLSAAQTLFNAGATRAAVEAAQASHDITVANYRQTVLTAFADVEDQLNGTRILVQQEALLRQASSAADKTEEQELNRYKAGQVSYTDVVTAQVTALSARQSLVQSQATRQTTAVALVQALGGGWHTP